MALESWSFEGSFDLSGGSALLTAPTVLTLEGVDTVADVSLNGHRLGRTNDAFVRWEMSVPPGTWRRRGCSWRGGAGVRVVISGGDMC